MVNLALHYSLFHELLNAIGKKKKNIVKKHLQIDVHINVYIYTYTMHVKNQALSSGGIDKRTQHQLTVVNNLEQKTEQC